MSNRAQWAVVDVETSGTSPEHCRIISIAALAVDDHATITDAVVTLLNPGVHPGPTNIHGITAEMLISQPQFADITTRLTALLAGRTLVAHNVAFDYAFLANEFRRTAVPCPVDAVMCTVELSNHLHLPVDNHKLATLARHWRVPQTRPHDALDDAHVLTRILTHSIERARAHGVPLPVRPPTSLRPPLFSAAA
ncbi:exonuclease domain-containing protein [Mycobacterium servetii]|uniref:Exonuclease domain-containing protein n=1 Tax=Mycobacterium servetii TaxID=3237418 RepID=A0ABV4CCU0_9MYCO